MNYTQAMRSLMSQPVVIAHVGGKSWRVRGCATCRGLCYVFTQHPEEQVNGWYLAKSGKMRRHKLYTACPDCTEHGLAGNPLDTEPVEGYPTDHPDGRCFACSGVRGPAARVRVAAGSGLRGGK